MAPGTLRVPTHRVSLAAKLEPNPDGTYVYPENDDRFTAAAAYASVANAVAVTEACWGETFQWNTHRDKLAVIPDAGKDLNAYYERVRGGVLFFHDTDKVTGETVYTGRSGEIATHETFHAILDAKRPEYLGSWDPDPNAFHESMGDIGAICMALRDERTLDLVVQQTGGDLSKPNAVAALGEQLGLALNHRAGHNATGGAWTRNAINSFTWIDPDTLPSEAPHTELSSESHSLSRLWTGASYDILTGIVNHNLSNGQDPKTALRNGGEELLKMQGRLLQEAPEASFRFADMARALLKSEDLHNQGQYSALIAEIMDRRQILPKQAELFETDLSESRKVTITLKEGPFAGMQVSHRVSGHSRENDEERLAQTMARLIAKGDILMTMPNQEPTSLIKPDGEPYRGVVRWQHGQPSIEPSYVIG